jgi:hypothetical protein
MLPWKRNGYYILCESERERVCVCSLSYPACKAHAPYYIFVCGLVGCNIFFTLTHKRHDFPGRKGGGGVELLDVQCLVYVLYIFFSETFRNQRSISRDTISSVHRCACTVTVIAVWF